MPLVICQNTSCIFCDLNNNFECKAAAITISEEWDEGCSGYEDYRNQPEYQNEYWIAVKTKSREPAKAKGYHGRRIEYKGRVFYTSDRLEDAPYCLITDAETGVNCGPYVLLEDRFDRICELTAKYPKVETLPLAEWDNGGYVLVKEAHHD